MNTVSDVLGNSGPPIPVMLPDGRELNVVRMAISDRAKIEQHLKLTVRTQLLDDRHEMSDAEYGLAYEAFLRIVAAQEMKYGGHLFGKFIMSGTGGLFLIRMLCRWLDGKELTEADMASLDAKSIEAIKLAVSQAMAESFPKGQAPAHAPGTSAAAGPQAL